MSSTRLYYRQLFSIAIPITLQNLIQSSLNTVDTIMVGKLGEVSIAGVGLANQFFFIFLMFLFGINSGTSIFHSQFHGKGDYVSIRKCFGYSLKIGLLTSIPFSIVGIFFAPMIIGIFSSDPLVLQVGSDYLRIIAYSFVITAVSFSYSSALRSIGFSNIPMMISLVVLTMNTLLNYVLIFGLFGFPRLGVAGAAWATAVSRLIEVAAFWMVVHKGHKYLHGSFAAIFQIDPKLAARIKHTIVPVVLNESLWGIGVSIYLIAYAMLGTDALASYQISNTVFRLFFVLSIGFANACQVMIGQQLGRSDFKTAIEYAHRFVKLGLVVGVIIGGAMAVMGPLLLPFFKVSPGVWKDVQYTLWGMGLMMAPKTLSAIYVVGILRGGGDTKFSLYLEILNVYLIGIPLSFIGVMLFHLPIYWVVLLTNVEEVTKAIAGTHRLISNKWAKNVVSDL